MPVVVSFVSQKGGVGKSTLARALAAVAGHAGVRLLLADLDPQQRTVSKWQKLRAQNALAPAIEVAGFRTVDEALAAGAKRDLVILDTPGSVTRATLDVARKSHLVVQPTGPGLDDLEPAILLFHELTSAGIPRERLVLVLCRTATKGEEEEARRYIAESGYDLLRSSIPERAGYRAAHNRGLGLTETHERALNQRADEVLSELLKRVSAAINAMKRTTRKIGKEDVA
jgi:chromosome partitioning protein